MSPSRIAVEVFISYANADEPYRRQLEPYLSVLKQQGLISQCHDQQIDSGTNWAKVPNTCLETSSLILLLVSADFLISDYCVGKEMKRALERHEARIARVIPILVRPVTWRGTPLEHLRVLPTDAKPITMWLNQHEAFVNIATGIQRTIENLPLLSTSAPHMVLPVAQASNNPMEHSRSQGKYGQTEPMHARALAIRGQQSKVAHPDIVHSLNNLATLYWRQGKYNEAEPLLLHALSIRVQQSGSEHPETAQCLNNLATLYRSQDKYDKAEPLLLRALAIREQLLGATHPDTVQSLNNLAGLYRHQGKYDEAEPLLLRALAIRVHRLGDAHPETAQSLNNLAALYRSRGQYGEAEPLYARALAINEQQLGPEHPYTQIVRSNYASFLRDMGKTEEAQKVEKGC